MMMMEPGAEVGVAVLPYDGAVPGEGIDLLGAPGIVGGRSKRAFDIAGSFALIVFFMPVLVLIAVLMKLTDRGPVVYKHMRIGQGGRMFPCYKFRTMVVNSQQVLEELLSRDPSARAEWAEMQKLRVDPRITYLGSFLRLSSLDELPQLFNVLFGQMSLVGPRPIVRDEAIRYASGFEQYKRARPGMTGLWQVSGRNSCSYERRVKLDVTYVAAWSLWLDIKIMLRTIVVVLRSEGTH